MSSGKDAPLGIPRAWARGAGGPGQEAAGPGPTEGTLQASSAGCPAGSPGWWEPGRAAFVRWGPTLTGRCRCRRQGWRAGTWASAGEAAGLVTKHVQMATCSPSEETGAEAI